VPWFAISVLRASRVCKDVASRLTHAGDKIAIVIVLLLLAVGGVMIVEFPGIIRAARLVATL
jgi:hypothetical protein